MILSRPAGRRAAALAATALLAPALLLAPGTVTSAQAVVAPTYNNYVSPVGLAEAAGEPSIGNDWVHDTTLFQANTETDQVTFGPQVLPNGSNGTATWVNKSNPASVVSLDPILFTDNVTGRTQVSQLLTACSAASFTDNITVASPTYVPSQGCGAGTLFDHQTIGGGPYKAGSTFGSLAAAAGYPRSVYYCAQAAVTASCARSDNGGLTYGNGVPIYNVPGANNNPPLDCAGLHGHLRVAPDGSVYVPNFDCGGKVAVAVSEDDGVSYAVRPVAQSTTQSESDPSIAAGSGGTLYLGWEEGASNAVGSKPYVAVSKDHGRSWTNVTDVGASFGINNIQFPEVIAGDDDRAAFAFIGTPTAGDDQQGGSGSGVVAGSVFPGVWHLYVATTYDGGTTWQTVDATPTDPVQRGCVWLAGGSSTCRNLLDFNDITLDKTGRILIGWADGCVAACATTPLAPGQAYDSAANGAAYRAQKGVITRQVSGATLFKAFDSVTGLATGVPGVVLPGAVVPEAPVAVLLPLLGMSLAALVVRSRRRGALV